MIQHLARKALGFAGALGALYGGGKLYNRWKQGQPPPAPSPSPSPSPTPTPSGGGGGGGGGSSGTTPGMQAAAQAAEAAGGTDAAGNTVQQILAGGTITGSQPGDTNGLYTTADSPQTITATDVQNVGGDATAVNDDSSSSDSSDSTDTSSVLDDITAASDIASLFG